MRRLPFWSTPPCLNVCSNGFPSARVSVSVYLFFVVACCAFEVWAAALMLLMISCFHIPVMADLDSPLSAPADQPSAATGAARAFLTHFQHTHPQEACRKTSHTHCLSFSHTRPPFCFHCLEMDFKEAACSQSRRNSLFNKACQVWFLAGRGQTEQGSHARLPGSSLMCCHKTCSWQRRNIQRDSVLLQHIEPWVLPSQLSLVHVSFWGVCALSESQRLDFLASSPHSISIHCSPSGRSKNKKIVWRLLGLWRDIGSFGSARLQIYLF